MIEGHGHVVTRAEADAMLKELGARRRYKQIPPYRQWKIIYFACIELLKHEGFDHKLAQAVAEDWHIIRKERIPQEKVNFWGMEEALVDAAFMRRGFHGSSTRI